MIDRNALDLFLDQVFSTVPVIRPELYIGSAVAQLRRHLNQQGARTLPAPAHELPDWLNAAALGPYESSMLATLLYAPGPVVVLRGGTGSGKSSVLGYLCRHVSECAKHVDAAEFPLQYRRFIVQIDVQTFLTQDADRPSSEPNLNPLLRDVARALSMTIGELESSELRRVLLAMLTERPDGESISLRHTVTDTLRKRCLPGLETWPERSGEECLQAFQTAADGLAESEQLVAWLAVMRSVHRELNHGDVHARHWPLVIVLDNVDPLPSRYQSLLLRTLSQLTSGPSWGNLRVVLAMRLSTFEQHIGALRFNHYDHATADPAEVVLIRTTLALIAPEAFDAFTGANERVRDASYEVLLELFGHLVDHGYFFDLLSAMSGTCIRNALAHAHRWCMSAQVEPVTHQAWRKDEFQARLRQILCRHYLEDLAARVAREVEGVLDELAHRDPLSFKNPARLAREMCTAIGHVLRSAEACRAFAATDASPRAVIGRKLREGLLVELDSQQAGARHDAALRCSIAGIFHGIPGTLHDDQLSRAVLEELVETLNVEPEASGVARALCAWVKRAVLDCRDKGSGDARRWLRERRAAASLGLAGSSDPESSRYTAETRLLTSSDGSGPDTPLPLNVFAVNGERLCPIVLRILYLLRHCGDAEVTRRHLIESLVRHHYLEDEIKLGLSTAMSLHCRLIFSGIDDHFVGVEQWLGEPARVVKLSSAGVGYLDTILCVPSYIQWALRQVKEVREGWTRDTQPDRRNVRGRLSFARAGFEQLVDDERKRIEYAWKSYEGGPKLLLLQCTELPVQSAAADTFFRALDAFIDVYRANYRIVIASSASEAAALVRDAIHWLKLADKIRDDHVKLFQRPQPAWDQAIRHARVDVESMPLRTLPPHVRASRVS